MKNCNRILPHKINRVVIKIGSRLLSDERGKIKEDFFVKLGSQLNSIKENVSDISIVSSGSIAYGKARMGIVGNNITIPQKQALASIGQSHLIRNYEKYLEKIGLRVSQILLTAEDLSNRRRFINAKNTFDSLFKYRVIPVVNENDTVTVEEIKFGDNDNLSAQVAVLAEADLLIILTNVDGVYKSDPRDDPNVELYGCIKNINRKFIKKFSMKPSRLGTGGMYTKLEAAYKASLRGIPTVIANGNDNGILNRIISGENVGTLILPADERMKQKKYWMAVISRPKGQIYVDEGAFNALKRGKSLLPSGIVKVDGNFIRGDTVAILYNKDEVAKGITDYNSGEIEKIKGHKSSEINDILGYSYSDEIIHRDKMVVTYKSF